MSRARGNGGGIAIAAPAGVYAVTDRDQATAAVVAERLALPLLPRSPPPRQQPPGQLLLTVEDGRPALLFTGAGAPGAVTADFAAPAMIHRRKAGHNELLGKAVGWRPSKQLHVLDATAGLGRDAFVLADLGCTVTLWERSPVLALLLDFAIRRAWDHADLRVRNAAQRMTLRSGDVREAPESGAFDVIYLDPMFVEARKALPGKEMQVLHHLLGDAADDPRGETLLNWASRREARRVVVKRSRRAPSLPGPVPGHVVGGKAVRFDVYPLTPEAKITDEEEQHG